MLLRAPDGVVMAADSRVTEGYTLKGPVTRDDSVKFIQLNKCIGVMTHGLYDIGSRGIMELKESTRHAEAALSSTKDVAGAGRNIFLRINNDWNGENPENARRDRDVGFIIGGLDRETMSFNVFCLESPDFKPRPVNGKMFFAGQWRIARFLLTRFRSNNATIDTLKKLAAVSLYATSAVDHTVGGPVRLATITGSDGFRWLTEEEMKELTRFNDIFGKHFRELLLSSFEAAADIQGSDK